MRKVFYLLFIVFTIASCTNSDESYSNLNRSQQDEIDFLKAENLRKDTMITQSIIYFNEIERNLSEIDLKEREIRDAFIKYGQTNVGNKEILLEKIVVMKKLKEENTIKVNYLQNKINKLELAKNEFKILFARLESEIEQKNKTIDILQNILNQKDKKYSELFIEYKKQMDINQRQEYAKNAIQKEFNTVYFCVGTQKELQQNNVISIKKKILKSNEFDIKEEFNDEYFTASDANTFTEILVDSKKIRLVGSHPEKSYEIKSENKSTRLIILDPKSFWKISKYLIIVTD